MHSGEKSNKCNQCDYAYFRASDLKKHLKMHSGEKSNKCNQCDYAYFLASDLKKHLKMHSGEKSNKCNQCKYTSSQVSGKQFDKTFKYTQWRKVKKCNQCDFASFQAVNLKKRLKTQDAIHKKLPKLWTFSLLGGPVVGG